MAAEDIPVQHSDSPSWEFSSSGRHVIPAELRKVQTGNCVLVI